MKEEFTENPDLDQHFERERNADPAISLEEAATLIALKGEDRRTSHRKKEVKKNVAGMMIVAAVLLISFAGYLLNQHRSNPAKEIKQDRIIPVEKLQDKPVADPISVETVLEENKPGTFPPVYPEENISRPEHLSRPVKTVTSSQKISMQAPGEATVTFVHEDKAVKLVLLFDEVKDLYIDDVRIDPSNYGTYKDIVAEGKKIELDKRQNKEGAMSREEKEKQKQSEIILNSIIKSLSKDGLIAEGESFDFRLQWNKLYLNERLQPNIVYEKYKALYEEASGQQLNKGSNIHIKH